MRYKDYLKVFHYPTILVMTSHNFFIFFFGHFIESYCQVRWIIHRDFISKHDFVLWDEIYLTIFARVIIYFASSLYYCSGEFIEFNWRKSILYWHSNKIHLLFFTHVPFLPLSLQFCHFIRTWSLWRFLNSWNYWSI